ncbi:MAG: immune inhibitor A, partial [Actinobacteria bacterium]|nr:immune inhibitor A [Actinomycetota bacterium]
MFSIFSPQAAHYTDLLFSSATYPTGSMRDYYKEVSYNNLDIQGTVYAQAGVNWYRMPQTYTYYVNGQSGLGNYPQNAQKLVEDAVLSAD